MDTGSREENASKQKSRASVLIQSEPILDIAAFDPTKLSRCRDVDLIWMRTFCAICSIRQFARVRNPASVPETIVKYSIMLLVRLSWVRQIVA
jgi:hypothetical protein